MNNFLLSSFVLSPHLFPRPGQSAGVFICMWSSFLA